MWNTFLLTNSHPSQRQSSATKGLRREFGFHSNQNKSWYQCSSSFSQIEGVTIRKINWLADETGIKMMQTLLQAACYWSQSLALDNQSNDLNTVQPPALFNTLLSPAPAIDKEIRIKQIKVWSRDNPGLLFTQRPKSARSSSDTTQSPNPMSKSIKFIPSLMQHNSLTRRSTTATDVHLQSIVQHMQYLHICIYPTEWYKYILGQQITNITSSMWVFRVI